MEEERLAVFLLWNLSGQLVGYQNYRPDFQKKRKNDEREGRYYCYFGDERIPSGIQSKRLSLWGVHSLNRTGPVFICEGIFDAVRIYNRGYPVLAMLTSNPLHARNFLNLLNRPLVAICDGDASGRLLAKFGHVSYIMPDGVDLGAVRDADVEQIIYNALHLLKREGFIDANYFSANNLPR